MKNLVTILIIQLIGAYYLMRTYSNIAKPDITALSPPNGLIIHGETEQQFVSALVAARNALKFTRFAEQASFAIIGITIILTWLAILEVQRNSRR